MKNIINFLLIIVISGCARTMMISEDRLGESVATMTIDASALKGYVSVPLINSKVVNVYLSEFPECINNEAKTKKSDKLGRATLTPKKHLQTVSIPSGTKVLISSNSDENAGGNKYTCWNSVHFTPESNKEYVLMVTPHKSFSTKKCSAEILEKVSGELVAVESAIYPKVEYKGFWSGNQFNHCVLKY